MANNEFVVRKGLIVNGSSTVTGDSTLGLVTIGTNIIDTTSDNLILQSTGGTVQVSGVLTATSVEAEDDISTLTGDIIASSGDITAVSGTLSGTLDVTGATTLNSTLDVSGIADFGTGGLRIQQGDIAFDGVELPYLFYNNGGNRQVGLGITDDSLVRNFIRLVENNNPAQQAIEFGMDGGVIAKFNRAGDFGIGTTSPSAKLDVVGNTELNGTLTVNGDGTLTGDYRFNGSPTIDLIGHRLHLEGDLGNSRDAIFWTHGATNVWGNYISGTGDLQFTKLSGSGEFQISGNSTISGTLDVSGDATILGNDGLDVRRGLTGGYGDSTDTGNNWGASIWGIGDAYTSSGHGSGFTLGNHYGLVWLRGSHPSAKGSSEGLYMYKAGVLEAHIGHLTSHFSSDVGIGTTSPSAKLDVNGDVNISHSGTIGTAAYNMTNAWLSIGNLGFDPNEITADGDLYIQGKNFVRIGSGTSNGDLNVIPNGDVGIGTSSPSAKLDVVGNTELNGTLDVSGVATVNSLDIGTTGHGFDSGGDLSGAKITANNTGDGAVLLNLETERSWRFLQRNTGGLSRLALQSTTSNKGFDIEDDTGGAVFSVGARTDAGRGVTVDGFGTFSGNLTAEGTLDVTGATTLSSTLDVSGDATVGGTLQIDNSDIQLYHTYENYRDYLNFKVSDGNNYGGYKFYSENRDFSNNRLIAHFNGDLNTWVFPNSGTDVGIGTTSPSAKLDVVGNTELNGNLRVEGGLFAKEFVVNTTRVLTDFAMSAGGKVAEITTTTHGSEQIATKNENDAYVDMFGVNDILHIQVATGATSGTIIKNIWRKVASRVTTGVYNLTTSGISWVSGSDEPQPPTSADTPIEVGDDIVRKGNTDSVSNPNRDHYIKFDISGNSGNATPFVGVYDEVNDVNDDGSLRLAYGNLSGSYGVTGDEFGFAAGDTSLNNNHIILTPSTTKFQLDTFKLDTTDLTIDSEIPSITAGTVFNVDGSANTGSIAGWEFDENSLNAATSNVSLISGDSKSLFYKGGVQTSAPVYGLYVNSAVFMLNDNGDAKFQISDGIEWVAYDTTNGLSIKTTDLSINGGNATFSGTLSAATIASGDIDVLAGGSISGTNWLIDETDWIHPSLGKNIYFRSAEATTSINSDTSLSTTSQYRDQIALSDGDSGDYVQANTKVIVQYQHKTGMNSVKFSMSGRRELVEVGDPTYTFNATTDALVRLWRDNTIVDTYVLQLTDQSFSLSDDVSGLTDDETYTYSIEVRIALRDTSIGQLESVTLDAYLSTSISGDSSTTII